MVVEEHRPEPGTALSLRTVLACVLCYVLACVHLGKRASCVWLRAGLHFLGQGQRVLGAHVQALAVHHLSLVVRPPVSASCFLEHTAVHDLCLYPWLCATAHRAQRTHERTHAGRSS